MKRSIRFFFLISTLFLSFVFSVQAETLSVDLSSRHVTVGEPVVLTLTYEGNDPNRFGDPDLSSLTPDFDVVGKQQSFAAQEKGAAYRIQYRLAYTLVPKREGTFKIPSFYAGGDQYTPQYEIFVGDYYKDVKDDVITKSDDSTPWSVMVGSVFFIVGGLLFLLSAILMILRLHERSKKRK